MSASPPSLGNKSKIIASNLHGTFIKKPKPSWGTLIMDSSIHLWGSCLALTTREAARINDRIVGTGWDLLLLQMNPGSVDMEEGAEWNMGSDV